MNCSNSTAAQLSGVSAVVVVAGASVAVGDTVSIDDPLSSALLTSSEEADPDRRYLLCSIGGDSMRCVSLCGVELAVQAMHACVRWPRAKAAKKQARPEA